jgi:energy-coupling factor transport system ATP-binding protein
LSDINVDISQGKLVLLTGPSGSGKSTLLHCINGLAQMHYGGTLTGEIWIAGRDTAGNTLWQTSELAGTVFQNPNTQFFQLTVEDEIAFGLEHLELDRQAIQRRIQKALADIEIAPLRNRDIFTLSSGEKQKVALASIIAMDQPLLLLDEPTANLDIPSIHELKRLLAKLKTQGRTMIVSEHRLWYLRDLADQVIVINDGRLVYDGVPDILEASEFRSEIGLRIWNQLPDAADSVQANSGQKTVLEAHRLSGGAGNRKDLLKDVNLSFGAGECAAVMGHNGVGKTTLSRLLTGLQKEQKGAILINGVAVKHNRRIGQIGCVIQQAEPQLFADTVLGELLLNSPGHAAELCRAEEILQQYDLYALKDRHPQTLSGGEKQRLAIAASIAMNHEILILDEPTSGMDMKRMQILARDVRTLCSRGMLVMIITHDIELVSLCCDKIVWMEKGTVAGMVHRMQYSDFFSDLLHVNKIERDPDEVHGGLLK